MPGRPDELFLLPECSCGIDRLLLPISTDELLLVSDNLLQSEEELNEFEEYFDYIMANSNFVIFCQTIAESLRHHIFNLLLLLCSDRC